MNKNAALFCLTAAILLMSSLMLPFGKGSSLTPPCASAEEEWKAEFDLICAKTQDAMSLSIEELKSLAERCDRLKPKIEQLGETQKKVYLKRLQMCRDLFAFVLKEKDPSK